MSNRDPRQRFDYQNWLNGQVAERAKASLTARDAAFAENNAGVTRAALTQYLNVCAAALGHTNTDTPVDTEVEDTSSGGQVVLWVVIGAVAVGGITALAVTSKKRHGRGAE